MKTLKLHIKALSFLAVLLGMASCVYPLDIEAEGEGGAMVIEGDILIGEFTTVKVSTTTPISVIYQEEANISAEVSVVDDLGSVYPVKYRSSSGYMVDTREASPERLYKLRVRNLRTNKTYESSFQRVCKPGVIDSLSYIPDEKRDRMNIAISMHAGGESYFKWDYVEDWEYHTILQARYVYVPPTVTQYWWGSPVPDGPGEVVQAFVPDNNYYCWSHNESSNIMVFSTENQSDDRFVDLEFYSINRTDRRISYIYHIAVQLQAITKDAYAYWQNVRNNSDYSGSLFAPNPSEVIGNITCLEDPSEIVYGYISAAQRSSNALYILNDRTGFYKERESFDETLLQPRKDEWYDHYRAGYAPYAPPQPLADPDWISRRCVDCRVFGGSPYAKPDYWKY